MLADSPTTTLRLALTPVPENEVRTTSCNPTDSASTTGGCCTPIVGIVIASCNPTDSASTTDRFFPTPVPENEVRTTSCNPTDSTSKARRVCKARRSLWSPYHNTKNSASTTGRFCTTTVPEIDV